MSRNQGSNSGWVGALSFASAKIVQIVRVTGRLVARVLLVAAPFLIVAGLTYIKLLTEYDINYYLTERPPEFMLALGIGGLIAVTLSVIMLRLVTNWFFALPLVLFGEVDASEALSASRDKATGHRLTILKWIVGWFLLGLILSLITTQIIIWMGNALMPYAAGSIELLMVVIGITLILGAVTNLIINLLSTTAFAAILLNLYRNLVDSQVTDHLPKVDTALVEDSLPLFGNFRLTAKRLVGLGILGTLLAAGVGYFTLRFCKVRG